MILRNTFLTGALIGTLFLTACGGDEVDDNQNSPNNDTEATNNDTMNDNAQEETSASEDVSETSDKGTRSNPYSLGETAEINISEYDESGDELTGTAEVTIDNVLRGQDALNFMESDGGTGHSEHENPELEYVVYDYKFKLTDFVDDNTAYFANDKTQVYNTDGSPSENVIVSFIDNFEAANIYQGAEVSGPVGKVAPKDEPFMIKYTDGNNEIWFTTE